ncbi:hypothetical protein SAMN02745900_05360 [Pseudomonas sp. URIL14HWK12:I8]|jgi:hypothetical protein|nr:hypothetical protein [Pseudomonas sp. OG7]PXX59009.1 hypothetical protein D906_05112 [Pseudomonas sp. LAIL14HWK12:I1]SMD18005.1 hypothetical protein SAMN05660385_05278 [Pseudomonas sp. URIL14HWK12:I5]SNB86445.1 hypothetical protein SAMN02745900_05360 [Pseudomonas sp. URIL14HWK12:I8]SNY43344.1 hypothetical protein SAMN05660344_05038 [Pseudomonas sp. LAMO17WK12:I11]SNY43431.1 hypothetical protein SAMN05660700_05040 [Pseudomonas sp. LAMO17WK12:I7]SNY43469.1 hypothetical protein SAMN05660893_0
MSGDNLWRRDRERVKHFLVEGAAVWEFGHARSHSDHVVFKKSSEVPPLRGNAAG